MKNYDFDGVGAPLKIVMESHLTKKHWKIYWNNLSFISKFDYKFDEDIKQYSLASCEGIVKIHPT